MKRLFRLLPCLIAASFSASAAPQFYTSLSAFTAAAASSPQAFGFNSVVSGNNTVSFSTAAGFSSNGFQFVGTTGTGGYYLAAAGPQFTPPDYNRTGASSLQGPAKTSTTYTISNGVLTITMPPGGVTAFGIDLWDVLANNFTNAGTDTLTMTAAGSSGSVVTPPNSGTAFLGFTSATPVTSVTIVGTATEEFPTIDNVFYVLAPSSPIPPTPAPSSLILIFIGLAATGVYMAWKNRQASAQ